MQRWTCAACCRVEGIGLPVHALLACLYLKFFLLLLIVSSLHVTAWCDATQSAVRKPCSQPCYCLQRVDRGEVLSQGGAAAVSQLCAVCTTSVLVTSVHQDKQFKTRVDRFVFQYSETCRLSVLVPSVHLLKNCGEILVPCVSVHSLCVSVYSIACRLRKPAVA